MNDESNQKDPLPDKPQFDFEKSVDTENSIADQMNELKEQNLAQYEIGVRKARNALFATGALLFIGEMITMARMYGEMVPELLAISLVEAGIFVALALWTKKRPYTAIITGLILFILIAVVLPIGITINEDAETITKAVFGGIFIKIIILVYLIKALNDAKEIQKNRGHNL